MSKIIVIAFAFFALGSCTKHGSDLTVETFDGKSLTLPIKETLRINLTSEPPSIDWDKGTDTTSSWITQNIMDGLTDYDYVNGEAKLVPSLAEKWEASDGARKWKFTLRQNVKWTDGQPFTPQNVVDGWRRLLAKETAAEYAYFLFGIKNAKAFNSGKVPWEQVGVKITGPNELTVELESPMSFFPELLAHHCTYPIRIDVVNKYGDQWTAPQNIVTLGAFKLRVWQHDKMIVMERNDDYWGEKANIKYVAAYMIQEQATAINLFDSGKLDSVHKLPSIELKNLRSRKEYRQAGTLLMLYYGFNIHKPPTDNVNVRKAIASAIDRKEIVTMLAGDDLPLSSWLVPGVAGYDEKIGIQFDVAKAKAYMKAAGFEDPSKFPKVELKFNTNEDHQRVAENIQAQLKRNLGINVELKNEEWKVYLNTLKSNPPEIFRFGWLADYPDADNFLAVMTSYSDNNYERYKNPKFDALIAKGAASTDENERKQIYAEAQKILLEEDVPVLPLYASKNKLLVADRVIDYPINVMERYQYRKVRLK